MQKQLVLVLALLIGSSSLGNAASSGQRGLNHYNAAGSNRPQPVAFSKKIRTPGQCFRYCRGTLGGSIDFCGVSCYR